MKYISFTLGIANLFIYAWLFNLGWNWFIADTFNITSLGYAESFGVYFMTIFFKRIVEDPELNQDEEKRLAMNLGKTITALLLLFMAILIKFSIGM